MADSYMKVEKTTEPVLMKGAVEEEKGNEKMVSAKRVYKDPRHRFQEEAKDE